MTRPSDDDFTQEPLEEGGSGNDEIYNDSEGIYLQGERSPVERDALTTQDDYNDYLLEPKSEKKSRRSPSRRPHTATPSPAPFQGEDVTELHLTGERTPVEEDEVTIQDDYNDYLIPDLSGRSSGHHSSGHRSSRRRSSGHHSSEHHSSEHNSSEHHSSGHHGSEHHSSEHHHHAETTPAPKLEISEVKASPEKPSSSKDAQTSLDKDDEYLVVKSNRSSGSGHHHHHHHHRHSSGSGSSGGSGGSSGSSKSGQSHSRKRRKKKMKTWKKVVLIVVSVILAIVIALGTTFLILRAIGHGELFGDDIDIMLNDNVNAQVDNDSDYIYYKGHTYKYNRDVTNMLFMGVDKRSLEGTNEQGTGGQSDVVVMMALDMKNHKLSMIAVPRDSMTEVALYTPSGSYTGMKTAQVCTAYAYGDGKETSCDNTVASVRRIFYNVPVKTYFSLDLDGISAVNDSVGGVDVVSPETISEFKEGESYHLEGAAAEHFVRVRDQVKVDASLLRLERQKVYAKSFMNTMMQSIKRDVTSAVRVFNESAPYSCTNLNASRVSYLAAELAFGGSMDTEIITVQGKMTYNDSTGLAEYNIDQEKFFEQFLSVYYELIS